jgi:hypothetical protein
MSKNWKQSRGSDNPILNIIGNICGRISGLFIKPYLWWGTTWTINFKEEIDQDEYTIDEVW